jgi:hypothetical protein
MIWSVPAVLNRGCELDASDDSHLQPQIAAVGFASVTVSILNARCGMSDKAVLLHERAKGLHWRSFVCGGNCLGATNLW